MNGKIAIIGISGLYPQADHLDQFHQNLSCGVDSIREVPTQRKIDVGLDPSVQCQSAAMLDRVDQFDHDFFQISRKEAEYMDPHQRILLQLACSAIENSGYPLGHFRGTKTAVFISASGAGYSRLIQGFEPTALIGTLPAALAGRIAYALDLRGPTMVVDTACSSSLVAVIQACRALLTSEAAFAIAGGVNIFFLEDQLDSGRVEIVAPDGRSKAFDATANGAGWGEGGGMVLLRPLEKAIEHRDTIHAVLHLGAVNQDGARSNGLAAPSPDAQCEVILQAWQNAGINPEDVSYIEAHGTGTKLGDPIEIEGIAKAFHPYTTARQFCGIGSVKTNIGHLVGAAGIAGLTKIVLSLKHKQLFPSLHFTQPNPYIDFANSPVAVNSRLRAWEVPPDKKRLAGISSFGLSGTNAHLIVEEAPAELNGPHHRGEQGPVIIKLSAKSASALNRYQKALVSFLERTSDSLENIAFTLNAGRDDYAYRHVEVVENREEALRRLQERQPGELKPVNEPPSLVLLLAGDTVVNDQQMSDLISHHAAFREALTRCHALPGAETPAEKQFAFLYGVCELWKALGVAFSNVIGTGVGNLVLKVFTGKMNLEDAWSQSVGIAPASSVDMDRLKGAVVAILQAGPTVFVEAGEGSCLSKAIRDFPFAGEASIICTLTAKRVNTALPAVAELYRRGVNIRWHKLYEEEHFRRVQAPTYPFEAVRCWVTPLPADKPTPAGQKSLPAVSSELYGVLQEEGNTIEKGIARIWGEVLKRKILSLEDDYFEIGGNSLDGMQVLNRIEDEFGVRLQFEQFYDLPTVRAVAEEVGLQQSHTAHKQQRPGSPRTRPDVLSSGQERLWFLQQLEPDSGFYNLSFGISIRGDLNTDALQYALNEVSRRHESLRTVFPQENNEPVQRIQPAGEVVISRLCVSSPSIEDARKQSIEIATKESRRAFHLAEGPLWRVSLVDMADREALLVVVMHHIISDAWSIGVLVRELAVLYDSHANRRPPTLPGLPIQYVEYALSQRSFLKSQAHQLDIEYWTSNLAGIPPVLDLPNDFPRPSKRNTHGARFTFHLDDELIQRLKTFSGREGVTIFMTLLAAFQTLLARYSGQQDICVGTPVAGRHSSDVENLIGFFVNTLVIRTDFSGDPSFRSLLHRVRKASLSAFSHQKAPFDGVVKALHLSRSLDHHALFQVMFMLQNIDMEVPQVPHLEWSVTDLESGSAQFDIVFALLDDKGRFSGRVDYSSDLFRAATIERMVKHFETLLKEIVNDPEMRIHELPLLTSEEQSCMLVRPHSKEDFASEDAGFSHYFQAQVLRTPEALALIYEGRHWNYRQLNERANQVAEYLRRHGVGREEVVGVALGRSADLIVCLLGVLKAGGAYLPLDVDYPAERLKYMIRDAQAKIVLLREQERLKLEPEDVLQGLEVISIDRDHAAISSCGRTNPIVSVGKAALAYVIYTSGSTGTPKGVMVSHGSLTNFAFAMIDTMRLKSHDRVLQFASVSFDAAAVQIYPSLLRGAAVVLHPAPHRLSNQELLAFSKQQGITVLDLPGAFWRQWIEDPTVLQEIAGTAVRTFMTGGESVPWKKLKLWSQQTSAESLFVSSYGPTECTVTTTVFVAGRNEVQSLAQEGTNIPLGVPLGNATIYILDPYRQLVPFGCLGTLYIGGSGVARGYIRHPELTASKFLPDPFSSVPGARMYCTGDLARYFPDGTIQFVGRLDEQVKIRGFRIEIEEVEAVLQRCPEVKDAAVTARRGPDGSDCLVAYLRPLNPETFTTHAIREFLRTRLPEFMVPGQFVALNSMPMTVNGKIDRNALPEQVPSKATTVLPPQTATEQKLAELWSEVLGITEVGRNENFFDLGGHSLLATRLVSRIRTIFRLEIPLRDVFEFPTITDFAQRMEKAAEAADNRIKKVSRAQSLPLSFAQQRLWFFEQLDPAPGKFNIPNVIHIKGSLNTTALERSVGALVQRHESLRTVFPAINGTPSQLILQEMKVELVVTDLRNDAEQQKARTRDQIIAAELNSPFDLQQGPLLRTRLLWTDKDEYLLLLNLHHIVFDGWSLGVLIDDLLQFYQAFSENRKPVLPELPIQYVDYACWQRERLTGSLLEEHLDFWKSHLLNPPAALRLPQRAAHQSSWAGGARRPFSISDGVTGTLQTISNEEQTTLFVTSLAAFAIALYSYTGQDDMVIGVAASNRTQVEVERLIGCFFNQMPLRIQLAGNPTFRELVRQVSRISFAAFEHQEIPFDLLVQHLKPERIGASSPFFQVLFVYQNMPLNAMELPGLTLTPPEIGTNEVKFDFSVFLQPANGRVEGVVEYVHHMFAPEIASDLTDHYLHVLGAVARNPEARVQSLASAEASEDVVPAYAFNDDLN
jgi:amino acid adenylation domain-containing protein